MIPWRVYGDTTLFAVDLATGDRTILLDGTTGTGPYLGCNGIAQSGDRFLVAAPGFGSVLAVDPGPASA